MKELMMNERRLAWCRLVPRVLAACLSCLIALHTAPAVAEDQEASQMNQALADLVGTRYQMCSQEYALVVKNDQGTNRWKESGYNITTTVGETLTV
jgi:hypothetical protein